MFCILSLLSPYSLPVCACACERGYKITGLWDYVAKQWYNRLRGGCLNLLSVTRETRGCCCPVDGADWRTIIPRHSSEYSILLSHVTPTDQSFVDEPTTVAPPVNIIVHRYYPPTVHYPPTFSLALRRETSFSGSNAVTTLAPLLARSPYTPLLAGYRHLPRPWIRGRAHGEETRSLRQADPAARILRGAVVLIPRRSDPVVVRRARGWVSGGVPILLACLRVVTTQAPPRGWVVTVRSSRRRSNPQLGGRMWAPGGCWGGSVSRLGENGEPYTSVETSLR